MNPPQIGLRYVSPAGDLLDLVNGPNHRLTDDGVTGIRQGAASVQARRGAAQHGQRVEGWYMLPQQILLPIDVWSEELDDRARALDWYAKQRRVDRAFRVDRPGTLYVSAPDGETRHASVRLKGEAGEALAGDPSEEGGLTTLYELVNDEGWWYGSALTHVFESASTTGRDFYNADGDGNGRGPDFWQADDSATGAAEVTNPGDVEAWGVWEFDGPHESIAAAIGNRLISRSRPLEAGHRLIVDGRPGEKVAWLRRGPEGTPLVDVTGSFSSFQLAPLPDGEKVPVRVIVRGTGDARFRFEPLYFRAFG